MVTTQEDDPVLDGDNEATLASLAASMLGTFQTVEAMTESFMRQAILRGVFPPGERLNLDKVAAALGVSRMPVRASLRQLESEGLVRIHAHRGATVSSLSAREIAEVYELRVVLEGYLLEHAMANLDDAAMARIQSTVDRMELAEGLHERFEQRRVFYDELYELAERPRALAQVNNLRASVGRYLLLQRVDEPLGHHGKFLALVRSGDVEGAKAWLSAHLSHVSSSLEKLVAEADAKASATAAAS